MPIVKKEEPKTKKRMSGAARRSRAKQYKSGNTNNVVKSVNKDTRVARYIKQDVQKNAVKPKDQQALVPVAASRKVKKTAKVQEAIKSQAFDIVRQKLVASLMQILPQTNEGNWNNNSNNNNQVPMDSWSNNNNYNNNNMNNGGWGNNNNTNNNMNNMNQGGFWSSANNNNNNNNMNQGVPNMQGGWNNNSSNNNSNSQARWNNNNNSSNNNRAALNTQGAWNNSNNSGRSVSGGVWSSSSNSNLNNNMSSAWSNNPQRSQSGMNNKNSNSNTSVWDAPCPEAPAPPRWNNNLSDSTLRNGGNLNQNQNLNQMGNLGGGGSNWNGSGNLATSMWSNDPRNAGGREYFEGQQMGGNDSYFNEQQNFDEYEQSSAELKFAIMDMNMPGGKIVGRRQQLLKTAFNQALADVVLNADRRFPPIQIKFSRFIQDTYKISVASRRCVEVLQNLVDRLPSLWPGSKLRLVAFQPRVKLEKASVYIRSGAIGRTSEEILLILERQNAGLRTDRWHVFHKKEKEDGVLLIVGIDKQSMDFLEMVEGRVFFLTSNAFFKLGKKPIGLGSNGGTGNVNNNNNNNKNKPSPQSRQRNQNRKK